MAKSNLLKFIGIDAIHEGTQPTRFKILKLLEKDKELYINEIAKTVKESQRNISFHMKVLSSSGFVYCVAGINKRNKLVKYYELAPIGKRFLKEIF
jgi:DNA-binding transcriptional ArsR family regulator